MEDLKGKGHGMFKRGELIEVQAPYLTPEKARELIRHTYVLEDKKPVNLIGDLLC